MRRLLALSIALVLPLYASAEEDPRSASAEEEWVEVGADTEAKYYVDTRSIEVEGETVRFRKRGVFTNPLTDNLSGRPVRFKQSIGTVEVDCGRRINRVTSIDMLGMEDEVVWSSGHMPKRMWEDVKGDTHGAQTFDYVCRNAGRS